MSKKHIAHNTFPDTQTHPPFPTMSAAGSTSKRKQPLSANARPRSGGPSTAKRARYSKPDNAADDAHDDDDDEDNAGNLDFAEQDRKRNQQGRKGRVVTAGYDTEDSDEEDEGDDEDGKGAGMDAAADDEEDGDDDMFDVSESKAQAKGKGKGKGKASGGYLSLADIEGQEFDSGDVNAAMSGESDDERNRDPDLELEDDEEDDEEEEDPVAAGEKTPPLSPGGTTVLPRNKGKKKNSRSKRIAAATAHMDPKEALFADMGYKLDAYNMKNEMESGRIDAEGNYIANAKDPHDEHDKWLQGTYNRKSIKAAREAQKKREEQNRDKAKASGADALQSLREEELLKRTVEFMQRGETVLETLQRLGAEANKHRSNKKKQNKSRQSQNDVDVAADSEQQQQPPTQSGPHESISTLETFTSLTSTLMTRFERSDLYDEEFELLLRAVRRSRIVPQDWDPISERESAMANLLDDDAEAGDQKEAQFLYRWSPSYLAQMKSSQLETFGPFPASELTSWKQEGYFGSPQDAERIVLKKYHDGMDKDSHDDWLPWNQVVL